MMQHVSIHSKSAPVTSRRPTSRRWTTVIRVVGLLLSFLSPALADSSSHPPELTDCSPRGLQIGGTTRVTLRGHYLNDLRWMVATDPAPQVKIVHQLDTELVCDVTLAARVEPGHYPLRVAHQHGFSNALTIGIDRLPQRDFQPELDSWPAALHGTLTGDQRLNTRFTGQAGETWVVDLEGQRLGSSIRPVLRIFGPDDRQLAISRPQKRLSGDTRLSLTLPSTGSYRVELHDVVYQGPSPGWFRLKIGRSLYFADRVYPLAVVPGQPATLFYRESNLTEPLPWGAVRANPLVDQLQVPWPVGSEAIFTGHPPTVLLSPFGSHEWTEERWDVEKPAIEPPLAISGHLAASGEVDRYTVPVKAGDRLRVELQAARRLSPLDGLLDIFSGTDAPLSPSAAGDLGHNDDASGSADPAIDLVVPANVSTVTIRVASRVPVEGDENDYRLVVDRNTTPSRPRLSMDVASVQVPSGSQTVIPVAIEAAEPGSNWQLESIDSNLATLLRTVPVEVDSGDSRALVELTAAPQTRGLLFAHLVARTRPGELGEERMVPFMTRPFPGSHLHPDWLHKLPIAIVEESAIELAWEEKSLPEAWLRGTRQPLAVQFRRRPDRPTGPVRLTLVTNQTAPTRNENGQTVADIARSWRIQEPLVVSSDQPEAALSVICPSDLSLQNGTIAIKGELLSDDGGTVLATVYTPVVRRPVVDPLQLVTKVPERLTIQLGGEQPAMLAGRLNRHPQAAFPVEIRLEGLPAEIVVAALRVDVSQTDWTMPISLPAGTAAGEWKDVRLVARLLDASELWTDVVARSEPFIIEVKSP